MGDAVEIRAIEEIRQLKARYFRAIDTQDWSLLRSLFTDDAVTDFRESAGTTDERLLLKGADAFVGSVSAALAGATSVHHGHTPEIRILGDDEAEAIWAMDDRIWAGDDSLLPFRRIHGFGHYHDRYRRVDGEWRISESRLSRIRVERD